MTEDLLRRLYRIKKENGYLTRNEIMKKAYSWEMDSLNEATEETYHYIWENLLEIFMRTKTDVKKTFKIVSLNDFDKRYNDYVRLSKVYNKHICFIKLDGYDLFFSLEDLMEKLIEDGFNTDYRVATKYANLTLALSENKIEEYLDQATHFMILKREV